VKLIWMVALLGVSATAQQTIPQKKAAAEYGKEVTVQMLPTKDDLPGVKQLKCDRLASILIDTDRGNEDFSEVTDDVLRDLRTNASCGGAALAAKDIDRLLNATSIQYDAVNELLRRVATFADSEGKKYNKLVGD
jgi:hypothetical protein